MVKYPAVEVQLSGKDGNAFAIIGAVSRGLKSAGLRDEAKEFQSLAMASKSYDDLLVLAMSWVEVS